MNEHEHLAVWKFPLWANGVQDEVAIRIPKGAKPLFVAFQDHVNPESLCMWALCGTLAPTEIRRFHVVGTGYTVGLHESLRYVGTAMIHAGALVFHVFEAAS